MPLFTDRFDLVNLPDGTTLPIPSGVYHFREPVRLSGKNITLLGEPGTVFRGTLPLTRADFTESEPGVHTAPVPAPVDALYVGGRKYRMARYPKATDPNLPYGGYAADCTSPSKTCEWTSPAGGYLHAIHRHLWGGYTYKIEGKNPDGTLILTGGWQNNRQMGMHDEFRYVENIREEMTEPGEWYYDEAEHRISVRFVPGDDPDTTEIAVSRGFFLLDGCENVQIENITFERSVRTFMETKEPLLRSDWTIYRGGALTVRNSKNCTVERCNFFDIGSNGVFVDGNNENITVAKGHFSNLGASGICFVGRADAVRSPLFEYNETQSLADIDKTPGPNSDNYPKHCLVEDCLIEYVGMTEKQATGVEVSISYGITIRNCTVCHTSRAGINFSEGTFGGHRLEGCDVFDTVRETGDHGSFNSWGRDRYWHLRDLDDRDAGTYAKLDILAPNVITRSRFRCDRGWDIDLDDGSTNYIITENLCLNGGIKLREGFFRTVERNIMVNNGLHFHVWYPESGDVVRENIVFQPYAPIGMPEHWGDEIDGNYVHVPGVSETPADVLRDFSGQDEHSVVLDADFTDSANGNYVPRHPKLTAFANFPTVFGVRYKPLKSLADTPVLPEIDGVRETETDGKPDEIVWDGAHLRNIRDDGEMSVYGTAGHDGALVTAVDEGSVAERSGLHPGDVIVALGNKTVRCSADVLEDWTDMVVLRKQQKIRLKIES